MEVSGIPVAATTDWGGYADHCYAAALSEFGTPLPLPRSGACLLASPIGKTGLTDAFGTYPLFAVDNPQALGRDLLELSSSIVSVYAVSDPLREEQLPYLQQAFDTIRPYKPHYIVDLRIAFDAYMHRHHRRYAKRAMVQADIELVARPTQYLDEWCGFYSDLCARHGIGGLRRFSRKSFAGQLHVNGCRYFRALHNGEPVGGFICYVDRGRAYAHLIATNPLGQSLAVQYALYWTAIDVLRGEARTFDLGGVPGNAGAPATGLAFFKSGWATSTRMTHFCQRVLNTAAYDRLVALAGGGNPDHFPAYRTGILGES
jgi:hypothetical protein